MKTETIYHRDGTGKKQTQLFAFITAAIMCCVLSIVLTVTYFGRSGVNRTITLDGRINPNTADTASLVRLPGIGPRRAEDIVKYRETIVSGLPAFLRSADLENIKGIGPVTAGKIRPWLCFE